MLTLSQPGLNSRKMTLTKKLDSIERPKLGLFELITVKL